MTKHKKKVVEEVSDVEKKKGVISNEDRLFILNEFEAGTSPKDIAVKLNRHIDPILSYLKKKGLVKKTKLDMPMSDIEQLITKLHGRHYWMDIRSQFTTPELKMFEYHWAELVHQFRNDVLPSEELQINQLVTVSILMSRCMKERKITLDNIGKIERDLVKAKEAKDEDTSRFLEDKLYVLRSSLTSFGTEYTKLSDKHNDLTKALKSTRDQRKKKVEDSKSSWVEYLKAIEDEELLLEEGRGAEILRMAKNKSKEKLYDFHTYEDGKVDIPILNSESVKLLGKNGNSGNKTKEETE
jgi:hypothetical protein